MSMKKHGYSLLINSPGLANCGLGSPKQGSRKVQYSGYGTNPH